MIQGANFQWNDSDSDPKVRVTGQKSELLTKSQSYNRADPGIRTESPHKRPWMGFRRFCRKPPLKPSWIHLIYMYIYIHIHTECSDRIGTRQFLAKNECSDRIGTRSKRPDRIGTDFYASIIVYNGFLAFKNCHGVSKFQNERPDRIGIGAYSIGTAERMANV